MARITNGMLVSNYMTNTNRNLNNMQKLQNQLSSGKEINRVSDNPYKASRAMQLYTEINANKQYNENIKDITNWLDITDTALNQVSNVFSRIRELMVSAGNGAYGADEKKAIQDEVKELNNQLCQILNTNFDGAYIFGGTKSTSKPITVDSNGNLSYADKNGNPISNDNGIVTLEFIDKIVSDDGNKLIDKMKKSEELLTISIIDNTDIDNPIDSPVVINLKNEDGTLRTGREIEIDLKKKLKENLPDFGESQIDRISSSMSSFNELDQINSQLKVEVSQGVFIDYNVNAVDIMEFTDIKSGEKVNLADTINLIISNLSEDGDVSKITNEGLKKVDAIISNILENRSKVGAMTNRMESAEAKNEQENLNMTDILSKTEDIDFTEKMMEYAVMQTIYMASLQTSAKILPTTILNYL